MVGSMYVPRKAAFMAGAAIRKFAECGSNCLMKMLLFCNE